MTAGRMLGGLRAAFGVFTTFAFVALLGAVQPLVGEIPTLPALGASAALVGAVLWRARGTGFLRFPDVVSCPGAAFRAAAWTAGAFVLLVPLFALVGHLDVLLTWPDPRHSQAGLHVVTVALWYPLWLAPPLGIVAAWLRARAAASGERFRYVGRG